MATYCPGTWDEYMSQQDEVGIKAEKYIDLINMKIPPVPFYAKRNFYIHQAIMLGYRLAMAELKEFMKNK